MFSGKMSRSSLRIRSGNGQGSRFLEIEVHWGNSRHDLKANGGSARKGGAGTQ